MTTQSPKRKALCCVCGNVRSCIRPRKHKTENCWLHYPVDRDWHRETGELKCDSCGALTVHAILYTEHDPRRDHAERLERIALGGVDPVPSAAIQERVRQRYRIGRKVNPHLRHLGWGKDYRAARAAGQSWFETLCGERQPLPPESATTSSRIGLSKPSNEIREVYDDDAPDGLFWELQDCPDCLRVFNEYIAGWMREDLRTKLEKLDASTVARLYAAAEEMADG